MSFPRSGTVDTQTFSGTKDFVYATLTASQSSNIGANDHVKFNSIVVARPQLTSLVTGAAGGSSVTLDTTTTYTNTIGAASLGRFTLRGGKTYKLDASPGYILCSAAGSVTLQWFDVTSGSGTALGSPLLFSTLSDAAHENALGDLEVIYQPGGGQQDQALVELRITAVVNLTSIGDTAKGLPTATVETI